MVVLKKIVLKGHINVVFWRRVDVVKEHACEIWQIAVEEQVMLLFTQQLRCDHNLTFTIIYS